MLYADTFLSISQIAVVLDRAYKTVFYVIKQVKAAVHRGFPLVWSQFQHTISGPTHIDESGKVCTGFKGQDPLRDSCHRGGSSRTGRTRWKGRHGDQLTLVAACRDALRVIRGKLGIAYDTDLEPVMEEIADLSQPLGEVWTDGLQAYRRMEHDHKIVNHDEMSVLPECCFVICAESCSIRSNASWLLCEERNRVHKSRNQAERTHVAVRDECCSSADAYPRPGLA